MHAIIELLTVFAGSLHVDFSKIQGLHALASKKGTM